jgi:hypothetical protein
VYRYIKEGTVDVTSISMSLDMASETSAADTWPLDEPERLVNDDEETIYPEDMFKTKHCVLKFRVALKFSNYVGRDENMFIVRGADGDKLLLRPEDLVELINTLSTLQDMMKEKKDDVVFTFSKRLMEHYYQGPYYLVATKINTRIEIVFYEFQVGFKECTPVLLNKFYFDLEDDVIGMSSFVMRSLKKNDLDKISLSIG